MYICGINNFNTMKLSNQVSGITVKNEFLAFQTMNVFINQIHWQFRIIYLN